MAKFRYYNRDEDGVHRNNCVTRAISLASGMSMGETDALWWKRVMTWLNSSPAHHLVVFTFDPSFSSASHIDWMQREDRVVDTFRQYIGSGMNMEQLRARIHLAVHRNIFAIDLSKVGGVISVPEYKRLLESAG